MSLFTRIRRRRLTADRDMTQTPIHTVEQLGPKRGMTPDGYMLCEDVPISRVGVMMYGPGEVPLQSGDDGLIWVTRSAEELFHPTTIASFNGKPVTNEHVQGGVSPHNWNSTAIGVVMHPRRGEGEDSDVLLADLLITNPDAIRDINGDKREVSAGYEADYRQTGKGRGSQSAIIGNHVALVEKGRCGPRCAIGDHSPQEELSMGTQTRTVTLSRRSPTPPSRQTAGAAAVRAVFRDAEAAALEAMGLPGDDPTEDDDLNSNGDTHIHIHPDASSSAAPAVGDGGTGVPGAGAGGGGDDLATRVTNLETGVAKILEILQAGSGGAAPSPAPKPAAPAPAPTGDDANAAPAAPAPAPASKEDDDTSRAGTGDSAALETGFKAMLSDAEVLLPGAALPAFDSKSKRAETMDSMCAFRRRILDGVALTGDGLTLLTSLTADGELNLAKQSCSEIGVLFKAAAAQRRATNNRGAVGDGRLAVPGPAPAPAAKATRPMTPAELNAWNREYYAKNQA